MEIRNKIFKVKTTITQIQGLRTMGKIFYKHNKKIW